MIQPRRTLFVILALSVTVLVKSAQPSAQQADTNTAIRIAALSDLLPQEDVAALRTDDLEKERDKITSQIRAEVARFIESSVQPSETSEAAQKRLRFVLATQVPGFEYSDPPTARMANLRHGRALVVAYTVVRPPHFDSALISGFREDAGRFHLAATTGSDFDGYTMFTLDLPSPSRDLMWVLAGGREFTFNGSKFRFRLYSFDGDEFRTLWNPDDVFDATIRILPDGIALSHRVRERQETVTEQYQVTANGLFRVR